jgi:hypothetical protein
VESVDGAPVVRYFVQSLRRASVRLCPLILHLSRRDAAINSMLTLHYAAFFFIGSMLAKHLLAINRWFAWLTGFQAGTIALVSMVLYSFSNASTIVQRASPFPAIYTTGKPWPERLCSKSLR